MPVFVAVALPAGQAARVSETTGNGPIFQGERIRNPTKAQLAADIAVALDLEAPAVSTGSSVDSTFLDRIHTALTGDKSVRTDAYRKAERALQDLGLTYDPFWDTSESSETGGSTVTNRAYSRIRTAITGVPRCFIVKGTIGIWAHPDIDERYVYDERTTGRSNLSDAGPGSRVLFYDRGHLGLPRLTAHGEVAYIGPGWTGPWTVEFSGLTRLADGISFSAFGLPDRLSDITEVSYQTYRHMLMGTANTRLDEEGAYEPDPGGDLVAERVLAEIPLPDVAPFLDVPNDLPVGEMEVLPATPPIYAESDDLGPVTSADLPTAPRDRKKAKAAEERAVKLTRQALEAGGWVLTRDRQKDGVGYDLLYAQGVRELHVEVKGIMSTTLAFNLTPKEAWRVETDPDFVLVAVTNVLSPTAFTLHLMDRIRLASARRVITGYRLRF